MLAAIYWQAIYGKQALAKYCEYYTFQYNCKCTMHDHAIPVEVVLKWLASLSYQHVNIYTVQEWINKCEFKKGITVIKSKETRWKLCTLPALANLCSYI